MLASRTAPRAAALLAAIALVGGLGAATAPAMASGNDHTVTAKIGSLAPGWTPYLDCVSSGGGAHVTRTMPAAIDFGIVFPGILVPIGYVAQFAHVPDGSCAVQWVNPGLIGTLTGTTASSTRMALVGDQTVALSPDSALGFGCSTGSPVGGTSLVGQQLTAGEPTFTGGVADFNALTYTWYRSGLKAPVQSSTKPGYALTQSDVGHQMSVVTSGRMLGLSGMSGLTGSTGTATCPAVSSPTVTGGTTPTPAKPDLVGKAVVGHVLTADPAAAPAGASVTGYQWYVKRVVHGHQRVVMVRIKGAHHKGLRMKERLAGQHVLVAVTYTLPGSRPTTVYSKALKVMKERMKE